MWSQILPLGGRNVQHNSSHNSSYSPNYNDWHHLSLSREMAEEQLRTWSHQPDLSLFWMCIHAMVMCALRMLKLHSWMLMLYQAVYDFTAGSAPWAVGAALVHFWNADYSQAAGAVMLHPDLSQSQRPCLLRAPTFFAALFMLQKTSVRVYGQGERFWQTVVFHSSA